jgi:mono/diheme cytochrome c family protein
MLKRVALVIVLLGAAAQALAAELAETGRQVYQRYCIGCHGEKGDGNGPGAALLVVKPRDFSAGIFEFKSTPMGTLPTDDDLLRTIRRGLPGNSMPSYELLSERERRALLAYVKTFSPRWQTETAGTPIALSPRPAGFGVPESVARGREVYMANGCPICHGDKGDGKGLAAAALRDRRGNPDKPRNFLRGVYEGGDRPEDLFRTVTTGIEGTPMNAFAQIPDEDRWHLIAYLLSLKGGAR